VTTGRPADQLAEARAALGASDVLGDRKRRRDVNEVADSVTGRYWLMTAPRIRLALEVALATGRPLLIEGDPGTGKSTLALAVSRTLGWRYLEVTITSRTQAQDLLWEVDHLRRLKDAHLGGDASGRVDDELNYVKPGVLWWAFDPASTKKLPTPARDPCPGPSARPAVLLIDEIDKADPEVPDNLLVPLGTLRFFVDGIGEVASHGSSLPLVIITSNRERDLSPAFLRRCVKLRLETPTREIMAKIALGHLGTGKESVEAVKTAAEELLGDPNSQEPPTLTIATFIDAARAARELGLRRGHDAWRELRLLLEGFGDAPTP
jgi:MoxR-like ATPase